MGIVTRSHARRTTPRWRRWTVAAATAVATAAGTGALAAVPAADAVAPRSVAAVVAPSDPFYVYRGTTPLASLAPGTVLATRTKPYHLLGLPLPLKVVQILFRTTDQQGRAVAGVTSVVKPLFGTSTRVVSYQSFYDSLNPEDGPSRAIAGDVRFGGLIANVETGFVLSFLLQGFAVNIADTQGPTADFAAGPEYGMVTLDSLRAALATPSTGIAPGAQVGLFGYSGGAIATNWAATLAPSYAPEVNSRLVGAAEGGVLVRPHQNLPYVDGSLVWAGVAPMAIVGAARGFGIDFSRYLSPYGRQVVAKLENASIGEVLGAYPGLTFASLVKPEYADPASIPEFVAAVNQLNLGTRPSPTIPMFIGQGASGEIEGTRGDKPGIGPGDGVMVAGDVRSLARKYCGDGVKVTYREYQASHVGTVAFWAPEAVLWLSSRFGANPSDPGSNCASIAPGNPLTPLAAKSAKRPVGR
ncbi:lipase family protein [Nocardioides sp.]|uniref:lipase family protein n=1 Tax=Nocardioides sp. TaxID=35761 RepID=UPI003517F672